MIEEGKPRSGNRDKGENTAPITKSDRLILKICPEARLVIDGAEQGLITRFTISGWFKKYWLLSYEQKRVVWFTLSEHLDHHVFRELRERVRQYEATAMAHMIAKRRRVRR